MANAKDEAVAAPTRQPIPKDEQHPRDPSKRKPLRRCAKCATPKPEPHFKAETGAQSPYCASCRGRFPSLAAARVAATRPVSVRKR